MKPSINTVLSAEHELVTNRTVPKTQWERILVPIGFSESSRGGLNLAVTLAADPEEKVTLLHVVETEHPLQRESEVMMLLKKTDSQMRSEAELRLEGWVARECDPNVKVEIAARQGNVADEILACAESRNWDLIVLATEPKRWIERLVSRSVVPQIQHLAHCDVIGIRPAVDGASSKSPVKSAHESVVRAFAVPQTIPAN